MVASCQQQEYIHPSRKRDALPETVKRPRYESKADLENEQRAIERYCEARGFTFSRIAKRTYSADYHIFWKDKIAGVVEYKRRNYPREEFKDLLLSVKKWRACREHAKYLRVPFILLVEWNDGLYRYVDNGRTVPVSFKGRTDRRDPADLEACVMIPVIWFEMEMVA